MRKLFFLLFLITGQIFSQITLQNEVMISGKYRLDYSNSGYSYFFLEKNGKRILSFSGTDEELSFPSRSLFIALPPNSHPAIHVLITKQQPLSLNGVEQSAFPSRSFYQMKGFLWIDHYYCAYIVVHPFFNDNDQLTEVKEFSVEIDVNTASTSAAQRKTINNNINKTIIDNPLFGSQWKSQQPPSYIIQQTDSWIHYDQDYVKLGVAKDGIYRITYNDLVSYGISPSSIDPALIKIYLKGKEIPIYVHTETPLTFGPNDYIEFLGRRNYGDPRYRFVAPNSFPYTSYYNGYSPNDSSYYEYLDRYSDTTIYWLNWSGSDGARIDTTLSISASPTDTLHYFDQLIHNEKDVYWDFSLFGGDVRRNEPELFENKTWNEGSFGVGTSSTSFTVSNLYPNKSARAFAKVSDYASLFTTNAHNLALTINSSSTKYDSGFINRYQVKVLKAEFSSLILHNGANSVNIQSFLVSGNTPNSVAKDWTELEYPRYLTATSDSLFFAYNNLSSPSLSVIAISGISTNPVSLYKFETSDSSVTKITNFTRSNDTLRFVDSVANGNYYFLLREDKIPAPVFFYKKKFTDLRSASNQADYIAITHPYFQQIAENYLSFIAATYGVTTKLVNIFDICDEYNYGFWAPEPIKEFLKSTHVYWQPPYPKYVLLIGKGTYDYYGNKYKYAGVPRVPNFVPPYGDPVSDTWFVQWDSTGSLIPQMSIGRIPAKTIAEFQAYFSKHQKYVSKGFDDWNKRFLFFSGGNFSDTNQIAQAKSVNDFIITNYVTPAPIGGTVANFYKTANPITNFGPYPAEYVANEIQQGGVFISYIGHSGTQTWDNSITDISQLENLRDRNPMISDFGCSTGKFAEPDVLSFSELAVNSIDGQAIAYIGNSSLGFTSTAYTFPQIFYKKLLIDTSASLGEVHRLAKIDYLKQYGASGSYGLFVKTNTLIGDPIVRLPIPTKPNFTFAGSVINVFPARPTEQSDSVTLTVTYFNLGSVPKDSLEFSVTTEYQGNLVSSQLIKKRIPLFADSLAITIPVKGKPGEYTISITADPTNQYDEIFENDNSIVYQLLVASSSIRNLTLSNIANQTDGTIIFLNPSVRPAAETFSLDVSLNALFDPKTSYQVSYDTFFTRFVLDTTYRNKRIWVKSRIDALNLEGLTYSYFVGTADNFLMNDDVSFNALLFNNVNVFHNKIALDTTKTVFSSISGGFNDGNTAVISKNGENLIPENTVRGFHVCVFDASTYEFKGYYRFDVQAGLSESARFTNFLDTLNAGNLVIIAISNDVASNGSLFPATLKTAIKNYGSYYIDSVKAADSWTMIGWKGALQGTVPEKYARRYSGHTVSVDTTIIIPSVHGTFKTELFGPVAGWKNIALSYSIPSGGSIGLKVLGVKSSGVDTLSQFTVVDSTIDLSSINAAQYPTIQLAGELNANSEKISPSISSIGVNYTSLPELGLNYQSVQFFTEQAGGGKKPLAGNDTVIQGKKIYITYRIYNIGGTTVKNIPVQVTSLWDNNNSEIIQQTTIDSLPSLGYAELQATYNTALGSGRRSVRISVDPDTTVKELFRDNNFYSQSFYVKEDTTQPPFPNLVVTPNDITLPSTLIPDNLDSVPVTIVVRNTGSARYDSVDVRVEHSYQSAVVETWEKRIQMPVLSDTIIVYPVVKGKAGEHQITVVIDPQSKIIESSKDDNTASKTFFVATTDFAIIQPLPMNVSYVSKLILLNPTAEVWDGVKRILLDVDTLDSFSTADRLIETMGQFSTSFDISSLHKAKRYWWRAKVENGTRDWTVGTFYLGDSTAQAVGQIDSAGWSENTFLHAAYSATAGARIQDTSEKFRLVSAGYVDGNYGDIELNGVNLIPGTIDTCHYVAVFDTNFVLVTKRRFNLYTDSAQADSLTNFLNSVPANYYVAAVIIGEGSNNFTTAARNAYKTIGSKYVGQIGYRDSWAIIGKKGAPFGSVPEVYVPTTAGKATIDTTYFRKEVLGTIVTKQFGPVTSWGSLKVQNTIPAGSNLGVSVIGISENGSLDTLATSSNSSTTDLHNVSARQYSAGKIVFSLQLNNANSSPTIKQWMLQSGQPPELAISPTDIFVDKTTLQEGEVANLSMKIFNVSGVDADSVPAEILTDDGGFLRALTNVVVPVIHPQDSVLVQVQYDSRGKRGSHSFYFRVDPDSTIPEIDKSNNSFAVAYTVIGDTIKPMVDVTFDGAHVFDEEYVSKTPTVVFQMSDNNLAPLTSADTSNFFISLNGNKISFAPPEQIEFIPAKSQVVWKPNLPEGENALNYFVKDIAGNSSDTAWLFVNVTSAFNLRDVYNIPNPFSNGTHFTFVLTGADPPSDMKIKIYTIAGRAIQEIQVPPSDLRIGFNKVYWDGRDHDGDEIANGVYLYRIVTTSEGQQATSTGKMVKMR